jgi:hypothetical protein
MLFRRKRALPDWRFLGSISLLHQGSPLRRGDDVAMFQGFRDLTSAASASRRVIDLIDRSPRS